MSDPGTLWEPLPQTTQRPCPNPEQIYVAFLHGHALAPCAPPARLIATERGSACSSRDSLAVQADDLARRPAAGRSRALARRTPGPPLQADPDVHPSIAFHTPPRCTSGPGVGFLSARDIAQPPRFTTAAYGYTGGGLVSAGSSSAPTLRAAACSAAALRSSAAAAAAEAEAAARAAVEGVLARGWG